MDKRNLTIKYKEETGNIWPYVDCTCGRDSIELDYVEWLEDIAVKNLGEVSPETEPPHPLLGEVLADIKESIESDKISLNNLYGNNALMNKAYFRSLMIVEKCIGKHLA